MSLFGAACCCFAIFGAACCANRSTNHSKPHAAEISSLILYPFDQSAATNLTINVSSARKLFRILLYLAQELRICFSEPSENLKGNHVLWSLIFKVRDKINVPRSLVFTDISKH